MTALTRNPGVWMDHPCDSQIQDTVAVAAEHRDRVGEDPCARNQTRRKVGSRCSADGKRNRPASRSHNAEMTSCASASAFASAWAWAWAFAAAIHGVAVAISAATVGRTATALIGRILE
jgi:hypothetical protein